jgi:hypothetical protein
LLRKLKSEILFNGVKETKIFLFCFPADAGIAETLSHPIPPSAESKRAKIHFPHTPFSFCPPALRPSHRQKNIK